METRQTLHTQCCNKEHWDGDNANGNKLESDKRKYSFMKHIVKMRNLLPGDNQVKYCFWNKKKLQKDFISTNNILCELKQG